jgi:hypothetical protein
MILRWIVSRSFVFFVLISGVSAQTSDFTAVRAVIDFNKPLRTWDGFGVNYVETSQTFDYKKKPQDYGGFSLLKESDKIEITELVFGNDGLKPSLVKMFLDPLHQEEPAGKYDHKATTSNMMHFVQQGLKSTRARGEELSIITTLYGPPPFMTLQKVHRGRDLDPSKSGDLINYIVDWANYLVKEQKLPLQYISLHNEGESWLRWPEDGTTGASLDEGHDYNLFWDPDQVNSTIKALRPALDNSGLTDVGITNGEPTNWYRFSHWGFADALYDDEKALDNLSLITSHGFYVGHISAVRWFGPHSSEGIDQLRSKKPQLHAWCTSTAWNIKDNSLIIDNEVHRRYIMNAQFVKEIHGNIYDAKVNGLIPWALIHKASDWIRPDPNPGSAFRVYDDGTWEIKKGYYYFKQVSRAGQAGMFVADTWAMDSQIALLAFEKGPTKQANAFVVVNYGDTDRLVDLNIKGSNARSYHAYRTSGEEVYEYYETAKVNNLSGENYKDIGTFNLINKVLKYMAPANSVTTFFEIK